MVTVCEDLDAFQPKSSVWFTKYVTYQKMFQSYRDKQNTHLMCSMLNI